MDITSDIPLKKGGKPNINGYETGKLFVEYFYTLWINNPEQLAVDKIIGINSKLQFKNTVYTGPDFINILKQFITSGLSINNCNYEIFDTGSRQIQILVNGNMKIGTELHNFSQFIMIIYMGEKNDQKWFLTNSILTIN